MLKSGGDDLPKVLMVAEKPSIAKTVAEHLSNGYPKYRKGISRAYQTYEFVAHFPEIQGRAKFIQTSVIGHVFGLTFENQRVRDPAELYHVKCVKEVEETTAKNRVVEHLKDLASECEYM